MNQKRTFKTLIDTISISDKVKGCLIGGLIGDCYGKPYKLSEEVSKAQLQKYFDKLDGTYFKAPFKPYSVNTAFSKCVGESLVAEKGFQPVDVAKRFAKEFFQCPHRDYGSNISKVVFQLRGSKFVDPFAPAKEQYVGIGSFGNKAATRIAPIVCFYLNDPEKMVDVVKSSCEITHYNQLARDGALLQSWALRLALDEEKPENYIDILVDRMKSINQDEEDLCLDRDKYEKQLKLVQKLLDKGNTTEEEVINTLGHGKIAVFSIPTSLYCFLRASKEIDGISTDNPFRRTVQYAVALGGDADTIASMAGTLAGAAYGYKSIGQSMQLHCEGAKEIFDLANAIVSERFSESFS